MFDNFCCSTIGGTLCCSFLNFSVSLQRNSSIASFFFFESNSFSYPVVPFSPSLSYGALMIIHVFIKSHFFCWISSDLSSLEQTHPVMHRSNSIQFHILLLLNLFPFYFAINGMIVFLLHFTVFYSFFFFWGWVNSNSNHKRLFYYWMYLFKKAFTYFDCREYLDYSYILRCMFEFRLQHRFFEVHGKTTKLNLRMKIKRRKFVVQQISLILNDLLVGFCMIKDYCLST